MKTVFRNLLSELQFLIIMISMIIVIGALGISLWVTSHRMLAQLRNSSIATADEMEALLEFPLYAVDAEQAMRIGETFLSSGKISGIVLESEANGTILSMTGEKTSSRIPRVSRDVSREGLLLGKFTLMFSDEEITKMQYRFGVNALVIIIAVLLVNLAANRLIISRRIRRPFNSIISAIQNISEGNYETQVDPTPYRDLNILVSFFNDMAGKVHMKSQAGQVILLIPEGRDITERKVAEEALYRSERRFRSIIQGSSDIIIVLDSIGNVTYESPSTSNILGYKPGFLIGQSPLATVHPEDLAMVEQDLQEVFKGVNEGRPTVFRVKHATGSWIDLEAVGSNQLNNPAVQGIIVTARDITERRRAEEALNESREKYRELVENANSIILRMDVTGNITFFNEFASRFFGFSRDEILGRNVVGTIVPLTDSSGKDLEQMILDIGIHSEKYATNENENICKDGRRVWIAWTNKPVLDGQGKCIEILCIGNDITFRKRADKLLKESEERYRKIVETTSEWIWEMDLSGRHTYSNPGSMNILGYDPAEFLGKSAADLLHEEDRKEVDARLPRLISEKKGWKGWVLRWRHRDGTYRYLESNASPIINTSGELTGYLGADRDITKRKMVEASLRESEERYRALFESSMDCVFLSDFEGRFIDANKAVLDLLGYGRDEITRVTFADILTEDQVADAFRRIEELVKFGYQKNLSEYRVRRKDGEQIYLEVHSSVIYREGKPYAVQGIAHDITRRKHDEAEREKLHLQLSQAQRMESVGRLAGGVAHDFNNMLSAILGHAELAIMRTTESDPLYGDLKAIQAAAKRSADLTRQLLAFARRQPVAPRVIDISDRVSGMIKMLLRLIGEDIDLVWMPGANLWPIKVDPSQIDQIMVNLCVNARDAISGVGKITIESCNVSFDKEYCNSHPGFECGEYVMLAISDNGAGMIREVLDHLFEPFYTTKEVGKGTGLGLATIYGIVKQNRGFINVYSEPGKGTTFKIYLPRAAGESLETSPAPVVETPKGGGETILLVEDEPSILDISLAMLEKLGYRVLTAGAPGEAIRKAKEHAGEIALLITDVVMPEMNGKALSGLIMEIVPGCKCLFASGYTANTISHHGVLDEGVHFIQKPFSVHDLAVKVREALGG